MTVSLLWGSVKNNLSNDTFVLKKYKGIAGRLREFQGRGGVLRDNNRFEAYGTS